MINIPYPVLAQSIYMGCAMVACAVALFEAVAQPQQDRPRMGRLLIAGIGIVLGVQMITNLAAYFALGSEMIGQKLFSTISFNWSMLTMAAIALPMGLQWDREHRLPCEEGRFWMVYETTLCSVAVVGVSWAWVLLASQWIPVEESKEITELVSSPKEWMFFTPIALLAPITEEIVFRLAVQGGAERILSKLGQPIWLAIPIASLIWALGHAGMVEPMGVKEVQIFLVGLIIGTLRLRRGIGAAIIAHFVLNIMAMLLYVARFVM